jgi:pimeloyl-ACP methyl ester carboxylesterase
MKGVAAFFGDVLKYQARRPDIQRFIRSYIDKLEPPVVLLTHSLGGIACFELALSEDLSDRVALLVTVGSQSPLLYEIDALGKLAYQDGMARLPATFPAWLNIYDRWDFLSFQAAELIDGSYDEHEVKSGTPFPDSHNAYWANDEVWERITPAVNKALDRFAQR